MPIIKSAKKRVRQITKRRAKNTEIKKSIKAATKSFSTKPTATTLSKAQSELDKAVKKGLIKKNTAARKKSNLSKLAKQSKVKLGAAPKKTVATKPATKKPVAKKPAVKKTVKTTTTKKPAAKKSVK